MRFPQLGEVVTTCEWPPRHMAGDWIIRRERSRNREADALANLAMENKRSVLFVTQRLRKVVKLERVSLQCWSDGGHRQQGISAAGVFLKAWHELWPNPIALAAVGKFLPADGCTSMQAEARGLQLAALLLHHVVSKKRLDFREPVHLLGLFEVEEVTISGNVVT